MLCGLRQVTEPLWASAFDLETEDNTTASQSYDEDRWHNGCARRCVPPESHPDEDWHSGHLLGWDLGINTCWEREEIRTGWKEVLDCDAVMTKPQPAKSSRAEKPFKVVPSWSEGRTTGCWLPWEASACDWGSSLQLEQTLNEVQSRDCMLFTLGRANNKSFLEMGWDSSTSCLWYWRKLDFLLDSELIEKCH